MFVIKETTLLTGGDLGLVIFFVGGLVVFGFCFVLPSVLYTELYSRAEIYWTEMEKQQSMLRSEKLHVCRKPAYDVD